MSRLFQAYRSFHEQGFIPIFVDDDLHTNLLLEACLEAGFSGIEYTLRRRDAHRMIPWIRKNYPELYLLVGSTIDDDRIIQQARQQGLQQLMTLDELADIGVDGFVSMHGFSEETIRKFRGTHLMVPAAFTPTEALRQFAFGAHFIKVLGPSLDTVRLIRGAPTFNYCPVMVTGGMTLDRIPEAVDAGAVLTGTGFDVILQKNNPKIAGKKDMAECLRQFREIMQAAVDSAYPELAKARKADTATWLAALPHQHHFAQ